jgi:hypothetical protein
MDLALLLVRLDEHARVAHEVGVALVVDDLHSLCVDEGDEAEHALLLVGDAHVLHRPVHAAPSKPKVLEIAQTKQKLLVKMAASGVLGT